MPTRYHVTHSNTQGGTLMSSWLARRAFAVAFACAVATPASADLLARKDLSLDTALAIATTAAQTCKAQGQRASRSLSASETTESQQADASTRCLAASPRCFARSLRQPSSGPACPE